MAENRKVTCDSCGADLTVTGNSVDYRVLLRSEALPSWGGAVTDMMIHPPIRQPMHFCGIACLKKGVEKL